MKVNLNKNYLTKTLKVLTEKINTLENNILQNILFKVTKEEITLTAITRQLQIKARINPSFASIEKEGEFLINGKVFFNLIEKLKNDNVEIERTENQIRINNKSFKSLINILDVDKFPSVDLDTTNKEYKLPISIIKLIKKHLAQSLKDSKTPTILSSVNINVLDTGKGQAVATDGFRASRLHFKIVNNGNDFNFNINNEVIDLLSLLSNETEEEDVFICETQKQGEFVFKFKNFFLKSSQYTEQFPSVATPFNLTHSFRTQVLKSELLETLDRCSTISASERKIVGDLTFDGRNLKIEFSASDYGTTSETLELIENSNAKDLTIKLNNDLLTSLLKAYGGEVVTLELTDDTKPIKLIDNEIEHILLPIKKTN